MLEIINAQGKSKIKLIPGKLTYEVKAPKDGIVTYINNKLISRYARLAGAPNNPGAGVFVHKKLQDVVKKGDSLFTIYSENKARLDNTLEYVDASAVYKIEAHKYIVTPIKIKKSSKK